MSGSTATRTREQVYTRVRTATYLTDVITGALAEIIASLGLSPDGLHADWAALHRGLSVWMTEGSLEMVVLECIAPDGRRPAIFEFPVTYTSGGDGDARFVVDHASFARYQAKLKRLPAGCTYRFVAGYGSPPSHVDGWGPTQRASSAGMKSRVFGTLGVAPHARASLRYLYQD